MNSSGSRQAPEAEPLSPMRIRFFIMVFFIAIFFFGRILLPLWPILVLSFLLTNLFRPVYLFMAKKLPESSSSILTCLLIIAIVFIPLFFFIDALTGEALSLYQWGKNSRLPMKIQNLIQNSSHFTNLVNSLQEMGVDFRVSQVSDALTDFAKMAGLFLYNQASAWAANAVQFLFMFFMMMLVIFFLLIDQPKIIDYIVKLSPMPDDEDRLLIQKFEEIANAVLKGNGVCGIIQGILAGSLFAILGLNAPILWGCVMAILAFLPIFGIGLVMIPTAILVAVNGKVGTGIFILFFYMVLSFSMEYLVKPKMVGEQVKMHTLLVFLSIIGGLSVYGVLGIIYGPLIMTAFLTLSEIYITKYDKYIQKM